MSKYHAVIEVDSAAGNGRIKEAFEFSAGKLRKAWKIAEAAAKQMYSGRGPEVKAVSRLGKDGKPVSDMPYAGVVHTLANKQKGAGSKPKPKTKSPSVSYYRPDPLTTKVLKELGVRQ